MRALWIEFLKQEDGQDLIEYTLVASLIGFAAVVGIGSVATSVNTAFGKIGVKLNTNIT
jgi:Flp pilus assembly pilin Flp